MQVFNAFMKISKKNIPMALIYIGIFLVLLTFFAGSNTNNNAFESERLRVSVMDMDDTEESKALINFIGQRHDLVDIENNKDAILDALYYGKTDYVLTIKEGYAEKYLLAVLNSFVFTVVSAGIAILIAVAAPKSNVVNVISNIVALGMSFLCGVFVDQSLLCEGVLSASRFLPAYWYIRANNMLSGMSDEIFSINSFLSFVGIEAIFAAVLFAIIILINKVKHNAQ